MVGLGYVLFQWQLFVIQDDFESFGVGFFNGLDGVEEEDDDDYVIFSDQDSYLGSFGCGFGF